jgi:2'-5' RNA ligase
MDMIRTFIAFSFPEEIKKNLGCISKEMNISSNVKWVSTSSMHLTMKFLGDVHKNDIGKITQDIKDIASQYHNFSIHISSLGVFKTQQTPTVLWAGIQGNIQMLNLIHNDLQGSMEKYGVERESRGFSPHITLARFTRFYRANEKFWNFIEQNKAREFGTIECKELILFKSELRPTGAVYTPLSSASLQE